MNDKYLRNNHCIVFWSWGKLQYFL